MSQNTSFSVDSDTQTVSELWQSIAKLSQGRVEDNNKSESYPLSTRIRQIDDIKNLVVALEKSHLAMQKEPQGELNL